MYGDGSVNPVKGKDGRILKNTWRVTVDKGTNPITGKRHRPTRIVHGTKRQAMEVRRQLESMEPEQQPDCNAMTFSEVAAIWQRQREESGELAEVTLEESRYAIMLFDKLAGRIPVRDFKAYTVEKMLSDIRRMKRKPDGTTISNTTLRRYYVYINQILKKAVLYDIIDVNPCSKVQAPRREKVNRRSLDVDEANRLRIALMDEFDRKREAGDDESMAIAGRTAAFMVALATGARRGEFMALTWGDVALSEGFVRISKSLTKFNTIKPPKSDSGVRSVSIDAHTAHMLMLWRKAQAAWLGSMDDSTPIAAAPDGGHQKLYAVENWWKRWRARNGFDGLCIHELRHTQATLLLAANVDVKTVQHRLGHASATLTLDCYAHAVPANDMAAAEILGNLLA